ncbi:pyrroline-5-carboxylate reductase [Pseudooceanicola spongiae]|uniref:Pyrroline-5-carboxylate reductase n=2 Tax=Pseudooceanicola spongiae TaxID=2613965 RepID=A0A7L9WK20_9RHOB|nr:pyrroline-5-carboxylate reductase [Pseudooceanicola spongiae]
MQHEMTQAPRIALVGASGWLGRYIGPALLRAGVTEPGRFGAVNRSGPSDAYAGFDGIEWVGALKDLSQTPDVVILSLRPHEFRTARFHCPDALVISVMAGVTVEELRAHTGSQRLLRALPNALAEVGQSYSPWLATPGVSADERALGQEILRGIGREAEVPDEAALDVLTTLSGAGPAFAALLAQALIEAAKNAGLSEAVAQGAAENLICGAAHLMAGKVGTAPAIVQSFLDYDGVIAAALRAAQDAGFEQAVQAAVDAGLTRVQAMISEG